MNTQQLAYALGQLLKNRKGIFSSDETGSSWHRETDVELLKKFCIEGYAMARKYGHFIVGVSQKGNYIGIPGSFMLEEQPLRGGEEMYPGLSDMDEKTAELVYGYWIAAIDSSTLKTSEA